MSCVAVARAELAESVQGHAWVQSRKIAYDVFPFLQLTYYPFQHLSYHE